MPADGPVDLADGRARASARRSALLCVSAVVAPLVVWLVLGTLVSVLSGSFVVAFAVAAVAVAALVAAAVRLLPDRLGPSLAIDRSGAVPADAHRHARFHNLVEGLCVAHGLPKPALYVLDDPARNAFSVGADPRASAVVVTTGLLDALDRIELEGVLAHELNRIKNGDVAHATRAVCTLGIAAEAAESGGLGILRGPVAAALHRAADPHAAVLADLAAIDLTRYPPGLIAAYEKVAEGGSAVATATRATAHLWIADPLRPPGDGDAFATHPPIDHRLAVLREL